MTIRTGNAAGDSRPTTEGGVSQFMLLKIAVHKTPITIGFYEQFQSAA